MTLYVNTTLICNCCGLVQRSHHMECGPPLLVVYDEPKFQTVIPKPRDGETMAFYHFGGAHICAACAIAEQATRRATIAAMTKRDTVTRAHEKALAFVQSVRTMDLWGES